MSALSSNLRMAVRDLLRAPGFTLTAVLTLALGIGANTAAFSLMKRLMLDVVPFPDADRLVMIHEEMPRLGLMASDLSVANYLDYRANASHFESSTIWTNRRMNLSGDLEAMSLQVGLVTQSFLSTLGVRPALGRVSNRQRMSSAVPGWPSSATNSGRRASGGIRLSSGEPSVWTDGPMKSSA